MEFNDHQEKSYRKQNHELSRAQASEQDLLMHARSDATALDFELPELSRIRNVASQGSHQPPTDNIRSFRSNKIAPDKQIYNVGSSSTLPKPEIEQSDSDDQQFESNKEEVQEEAEYDPMKDLDHLDRLQTDFDLNSTTITPFDQVKYIQAMFNPISKGPNREIITVQKVNPSVQRGTKQERQQLLEKGEIEEKRNYRYPCPNGHNIKRQSGDQKYKRLECAFCNQISSKFLICNDPGCAFVVCQQCNLKAIRRKALIRQTQMHHFYKNYYLDVVQKDQQDIQASALVKRSNTKVLSDDEEVDEKFQGIQDLKSLIQRTGSAATKAFNESNKMRQYKLIQKEREIEKKFGDTKSVRFSDVEELKKKDAFLQKDTGFKRYIIIGFWHWNDEVEQYTCYRMFKVVNPLITRYKSGEKELVRFLYVGENQQLFYFQKQNTTESQKNIKIMFVDFEKAMGNEDQLKKAEFSLYKLPKTEKSFKICPDSNVYDLLDIVCGVNKSDGVEKQLRYEPIVHQFQKFDLLTMHSPYLMASDSGKYEWISSRQSWGDNIVFFQRYEKECKVLQIPNVDCLLKITTDCQNNPTDIYFLRENQIIQLTWDQMVQNQEFFSYQVIQGLKPIYSQSKAYRILPADQQNYYQAKKELDRAIKQSHEKRSVIISKFHGKDQQRRITIIFTFGCLFTFQLCEKTELSQSIKWQGEIGELRNFQLSLSFLNSKCIGEGKDGQRGRFTAKGNLGRQYSKWTGETIQQGRKKQFQINNMSIENDGKVQGDGFQDGKQFNITGQLKEDGKTIHFQKKIEDSTEFSSKFEGIINYTKNYIVGTYKTGDQKEGFFWLEAINMQQFQLKIQYESSQENQIELIGDLDKTNFVFYGKFTASNKLQRFVCVDYKNPQSDANSFTLIGSDCLDRAELLFKSSDFADANFATLNENGIVQDNWVSGRLKDKKMLKEKIQGYKTLNFTAINLDSEDFDGMKNEIKLTCQIQNSFQDAINRQNKISLPYYTLMPFEINKMNGVVDWKTVLFFNQESDKTNRMVFVFGNEIRRRQESLQDHLKKIKLPQIPLTIEDNYCVYYPVLAYKTGLPSNEEIAIVNLVKNEPQKYVNISPYKFVKFLDMGINSERHFNRQINQGSVNTIIYFIVERDQKYFLMSYCCFPYPIERRKIDKLKKTEFQKSDQICMITGFVDQRAQSQRVKARYYKADKIKKASCLVRHGNNGNQLVLVLQCLDQIYAFNTTEIQSNDSSFYQIQRDQVMVEYPMQRSPGEHLYFIEENEVGIDTLCSLTYLDRDNITKNTVFRCDGFDIQALQVCLDSSTIDFNLDDIQHYILIFTSDKKLRRINYSKEEYQNSSIIDMSYHPCISEITNRLYQSVWQNLVLGLNCIYALLEPESNKDQLETSLFSTFSYFYKQLSEIGFQDDRRYAMIQDQRKILKRIKQTVRSIDSIPFIGKLVQVSNEAHNNFFKIMQDFGTRRIDLTRADSQVYCTEKQILIGNSYVGLKLRHCRQIMLFDQKELTYRKNIDYTNLFPLSYCEKGKQYFAADDSEKDSDVWDKIVQVDEKGKFQEIYSDIRGQIDYVQEKIFNQIEGSGQISFPLKNWALNFHGEEKYRLCIFAFSYDKNEDEASQFKQKIKSSDIKQTIKLSNEIDLQVLPTTSYDDDKLDFVQIDFSNSQYYSKTSELELLAPKLPKRSKTIIDGQSKPQEGVQRQAEILVIHSRILEMTDNVQVLFTRDYLVIKHDFLLLWTKRETFKSSIKKYFKKNQNLTFTDPKDRFETLRNDPNACKVPFQCIDFTNIDYKIWKNGFQIKAATKYDLKITDKIGNCLNAVQISFTDLSVLWDLDRDQELTFISKLDQFASQKTYTTTGFVPHAAKDNESKRMEDHRFYTQNENKSFIMSPKTKKQFSVLMRTFSGINLLDILDIKKTLDEGKIVHDTSLQSMLQNYNGLTFFHLFRDHSQFIDKLLQLVKANGYDQIPEEDEQGNVSDNIIIRQIYWILQVPEIKENKTKELKANIKRPSIIQSCIFDRRYHSLIDKFIDVLMLSREYRFTDLVGTYNCFEKIFEIQSRKISNFLEDSHIETTESLQVDTILWDPKHKLITFGTNHCMMSSKNIILNVEYQQLKSQNFLKRYLRETNEKTKGLIGQEFNDFVYGNQLGAIFDPNQLLLEQKTYKTTKVSVKILEIDWLSRHLRQFYEFLNNISDPEIFGNEFIKILLQQQYYSNQLVIRVFLPFVFFLCCNLIYFTHYVPHTQVKTFFGRIEDNDIDQGILRVLILVNVLYTIVLEVRQVISSGSIWNYIKDFWNIVVWFNQVTSVIVVYTHGMNSAYDRNDVLWLTSIACVAQWAMVYYWLRLFPELAFYVTMIYETVKDIGWFMITLLLCITIFANAYYVLNLVQPDLSENEEYPQLWNTNFGYQFVDSFFSQYLVGLGEFNLDSFPENPNAITNLVFFIFSTLFTQIVFMNMLIAIMGETYGRVSAAAESTQLMERSHLYADYMWAITLTKEMEGKRYLYVVKPLSEESKDQSELIQEATKEIKSQLQESQTKQTEQVEAVQSKLQLVLTNHHKMRLEIEKQQQTVQEMKQDIKILKETMKNGFEQLMQKMR